MVVVTLTDCPPKVRGDLSKWLIEISTGVYVGHVSARVREKLWARICENVKNGRATMVFSMSGEQKLGFWVHNTHWQPVDYDGIQLVRHPLSGEAFSGTKGPSRAAISRMAARKINTAAPGTSYCIVDLETTGLSSQEDAIIEMAAIRVRKGDCKEEYEALVRCNRPIPPAVALLTGLTDQQLQEKGVPLGQALEGLLAFVGEDPLVSHNVAFDHAFLQRACSQCSLPPIKNSWVDTLDLSRQYLRDIENYQLATVARYFSIEPEEVHRALEDCYTTYGIYEKLKERKA